MKTLKNQEILKQFDEFIDQDGDIVIGDLRYAKSYVFKTIDPIAYGSQLTEWAIASDKYYLLSK